MLNICIAIILLNIVHHLWTYPRTGAGLCATKIILIPYHLIIRLAPFRITLSGAYPQIGALRIDTFTFSHGCSSAHFFCVRVMFVLIYRLGAFALASSQLSFGRVMLNHSRVLYPVTPSHIMQAMTMVRRGSPTEWAGQRFGVSKKGVR